jgi:hypothetical protein
MDETLPPSAALAVLARAYRRRATGVLRLGPEGDAVHVVLREGQIVAVGPLAGPPVRPATGPEPEPPPRPDDSARLKLDRILEEIGVNERPRRRAPSPPPPPAPAPSDPKERLLEALAEPSTPAQFEEGTQAPADVAPTAGATEPLILEAVRNLRGEGTIRGALGDLDQRLVATAVLADDRTLTLTEGHLLSRIDGQATAREVLQLLPLDPDETERTLLGLLLTGRVEYRPLAEAVGATAASPPSDSPDTPETTADAPSQVPDAAPEAEATAELMDEPTAELAEDEAPDAVPAAPEMDTETLEARREVVEIFQSLPLKNHFEVLGVEPGCTDADVRRAYVALAKRFHPDVQRDARLADLHDILEAIFIRIGEAWEVLGDAKSRASYESRFTKVARPGTEPSSPRTPPPSRPAPAPAPAPPPSSPTLTAPAHTEEVYVSAEETLLNAQLLIFQSRYWDAIQMLEGALPHLQPRRHQTNGRILLARAYAKNPNWVRRAEEILHDAVREDPANAEAHYELGLLYKESGLAARAQAMFRRTVELKPEHRKAAAELSGGSPAGGGLLKRIFKRGKAS